MKKLLNTLYVTSENSYLSLDGENIVVLDSEKEVGRLPLHNLEGIVSFWDTEEQARRLWEPVLTENYFFMLCHSAGKISGKSDR